MRTGEMDVTKDPQFESALEEFRDAARIAAEMPEAFWAEQRRAVMARVAQSRASISGKRILAWATAAVLVAAALAIWVEGPRALPAPDFAAGYDDSLLRDIERLTATDMPLALEPASVQHSVPSEPQRPRPESQPESQTRQQRRVLKDFENCL
ncbi:MAG: hypothetical protein H6Q05_2208 [Acidobacteria bacterium]|jgi:hypothetical protein|nr:hypothetical protein [Acidobacteriota bacterium]